MKRRVVVPSSSSSSSSSGSGKRPLGDDLFSTQPKTSATKRNTTTTTTATTCPNSEGDAESCATSADATTTSIFQQTLQERSGVEVNWRDLPPQVQDMFGLQRHADFTSTNSNVNDGGATTTTTDGDIFMNVDNEANDIFVQYDGPKPASLQDQLGTYHEPQWYSHEPSVNTPLKPHQMDGTEFLHDRTCFSDFESNGLKTPQGAILADRMGLGKTLQTLTAIVNSIVMHMEAFQQNRRIPSSQDDAVKLRSRAYVRGMCSLVVCPLIALDTWANEVRRHTSGLAVAHLENDNTLLVYTHPLRPHLNKVGAVPEPLRSTRDTPHGRPITISDLYDFDIVLVTYNRLVMSMPHELAMVFDNFNLFRPQSISDTEQRLRYSQFCCGMTEGRWDMYCRPLAPPMCTNTAVMGTSVLWAIHFNWLIFDEAHFICNSETKRMRSCWTLCGNNIALLTATPSSNHIAEYASLLLIARAHPLPPLDAWKAMKNQQMKQRRSVSSSSASSSPVKAASASSLSSVSFIGDSPEPLSLSSSPSSLSQSKITEKSRLIVQTELRLSALGSENLSLMQNAIRNFVLARTERDVGLNNQFTVHRWVLRYPFQNPTERLLNEAVLTYAKHMFSKLDAGTITKRQLYLSVLPLFTRAKQIAVAANSIVLKKSTAAAKAGVSFSSEDLPTTTTATTPTNAVARFFSHPSLSVYSTKMQMVRALLKDPARIAPREKVVICCSYSTCLYMLSKYLSEEDKIKHVVITGSVRDRQARAQIIDQFQTDPSIRVALLSLRIAQSIDLTAACHMIFLDPWHNPSVQEQAGGRLTRLGQTASHVHFWYLLIDGSIEEPTHAAAERKRREAEFLLRGYIDPNEITTDDMLNLDELRRILELPDAAQQNEPLDEFLLANPQCQPLMLRSCETTSPSPGYTDLIAVVTATMNITSETADTLRDAGLFGIDEDADKKVAQVMSLSPGLGLSHK